MAPTPEVVGMGRDKATFADAEAELVPVAEIARDDELRRSNCEQLAEVVAGGCLSSISCCKVSCEACASVPGTCAEGCSQCVQESCSGECAENISALCILSCFIVFVMAIVLVPLLLPLWLEPGRDCSEFVPSAGIVPAGGNFASSDYELVEFFSKAKLRNKALKKKFYLEATFIDSQDINKGRCRIDKNGYSCSLCTLNGVCTSFIEGFQVDQKLSADADYEYTIKIEVTENITLVGEIKFPPRGVFKATYTEPELSFTFKEKTLLFPTGDSKFYRHRINFGYGSFSSGGSLAHWPGASIYEPHFGYSKTQGSRYCIPSLKSFDLNDFLNQTIPPSDAAIIEAVLQGETLAHVQFMVRQAALISRSGYVAVNLFYLIWSIMIIIILLCCIPTDDNSSCLFIWVFVSMTN